MTKPKDKQNKSNKQLMKAVLLISGALFIGLVVYVVNSLDKSDDNNIVADKSPAPMSQSVAADDVKDGVHVASGLADDDGLDLVLANCTPCHSAKLVTQNRATKEGWKSMIRWMQQSQNLWDLGDNEEKILNYLAKNYPVVDTGRRANLADVEWYSLK